MSERERPSDVVAETHLSPTGSLTGVAPRSRWGSKDIRAARAGPQPARIQTVGVAQRASAWWQASPATDHRDVQIHAASRNVSPDSMMPGAPKRPVVRTIE